LAETLVPEALALSCTAAANSATVGAGGSFHAQEKMEPVKDL
jgi:hypothetical protein